MLKHKIKLLPALKITILGLKAKGKRIVFTNGCFDLLHYGHAQYLEQAKKLGDILVVGVNSDSSVKSIKGLKRPIVDELNRLHLIASLQSVDYAILFSQDTPINLIKELHPDILVKGADWNVKDIVGGDVVSAYGGKIKRIKLVKGLSTTHLIDKIAKLSKG